MGVSVWQLAIVAVILVLVFGTKRLRGVGGDLGTAIRDFKKELNSKDGYNTSDKVTNSLSSSVEEDNV